MPLRANTFCRRLSLQLQCRSTTARLLTVVSNYCYRQIPFPGGSYVQLQIRCKKNYFPLQRQICGNVNTKSLITDTDSLSNSNYFPSQTQISGSKQINCVIVSATTVIGGVPMTPDPNTSAKVSRVYMNFFLLPCDMSQESS